MPFYVSSISELDSLGSCTSLNIFFSADVALIFRKLELNTSYATGGPRKLGLLLGTPSMLFFQAAFMFLVLISVLKTSRA